MGAALTPLLPALERLLAVETQTLPPLELEEILGGGSARRFFRVRTTAGQSVVAMYVPAQSHEIVKPQVGTRAWPFLEVRDLLDDRGVRVPRLLGTACEDGLILVEDLGDTLAQHLARFPNDREELYVMAVRDLAEAQSALRTLPIDSVVRQRAFDEDLLRREVEHFREWALEARGIRLSQTERTVFDRAAEHLAEMIASWPRGFVHRDYQSRNLMVVRGSDGQLALAWIDFQDAMLGPRIYDLVALLSDSYQSFSPEFIDARLNEFAQQLGLEADERPRLEREFRLVTVQRKLKDAGRFVFFDREHGNSAFLGFVEATIVKAQLALDGLRDDAVLSELGTLLERLFPRRA